MVVSLSATLTFLKVLFASVSSFLFLSLTFLYLLYIWRRERRYVLKS